MAPSLDEVAERERRRWTRENAHLWIRHDAHRFMRPDAQRFMRPDAARFIPPSARGWRHLDEKLWNFHAAHQQRAKRAAEMGENLLFAAELARLQTQHDSIRRAFVQLQQERQRKRDLERADAERLKRRYDAAWEKFTAAFNRHWETCRKALHPSHYDPNQPRVPAGYPDGGQWTRLAASDKPRFGPAAIAAIALDAAKRAIEAYRTSNSLWDLFGNRIGTVTVTTVDEKQVFGSNRQSPTYTSKDSEAAFELRDTLLRKYPDIMNIDQIGRKPNDAVFHAETTVLLRAAREHGGTLAGRSLDVYTDRPICWSCDKVLPLIGLEIGNPTVTFIEPSGARQVMRNGAWTARGDK